MQKVIIDTNKAPKAIGPYSQAVRAGSLIFVSGQIPINPDSNEVIKGSVARQTEQVLKNIGNILEAAGAGLINVVKTTVYLKDLKTFNDMNQAYSGFFAPPFPARATVEVSNLPKGVDVEIDAVAFFE